MTIPGLCLPDPVTATAQAALEEPVTEDFAQYASVFLNHMETYRALAVKESRFGGEAMIYATEMFQCIPDMAVAGFEAAIPAQVAAALYAHMDTQRHMASGGFWKNAVARRGRIMGDLYLTVMREVLRTMAAVGTLRPGLTDRLWDCFQRYRRTGEAPRMAALGKETERAAWRADMLELDKAYEAGDIDSDEYAAQKEDLMDRLPWDSSRRGARQ